MHSIIPQPDVIGTAVPMDVSAVAFVLANMTGIPDVWAPARPGELWEDVVARKYAARDMVDELLAEFAGSEVAA